MTSFNFLGDFCLTAMKEIERRCACKMPSSARTMHFDAVACVALAVSHISPTYCLFAMTLYITQFRPLVWHNTHPYVLVDRHEDITDPNEVERDADCSRSVVFYGYVRGTHLKPNMKVHMIGVGDYSMASVSTLPDPCPVSEKDKERTSLSKRSLLFAPLSDVGAVAFDNDAIYIDIPKANYTKKENLALPARAGKRAEDDDDDDEDARDESDEEPEYESDTPAGILKGMQDMDAGIDEKMQNSTLRLFRNSEAVAAGSDSSDEDDEEDEDESEEENRETSTSRRPARFEAGIDDDASDSDSDSSDEDGADEMSVENNDDEDDDEDALDKDDDSSSDESSPSQPETAMTDWRSDITRRAAQSFLDRQSASVNLQELIYGAPAATIVSEEDERREKRATDGDSSDDEFFKPKSRSAAPQRLGDGLNARGAYVSSIVGDEDSSRLISFNGKIGSIDVTPWLEEG
jgi:ribosome biogenesis protein BMS1